MFQKKLNVDENMPPIKPIFINKLITFLIFSVAISYVRTTSNVILFCNIVTVLFKTVTAVCDKFILGMSFLPKPLCRRCRLQPSCQQPVLK